METMKRKWGKPVTEVQRFMPQYCLQPCDSTVNGYRVWAPWIENGKKTNLQLEGEYRDDEGRTYFGFIDVPCDGYTELSTATGDPYGTKYFGHSATGSNTRDFFFVDATGPCIPKKPDGTIIESYLNKWGAGTRFFKLYGTGIGNGIMIPIEKNNS